MSLLSMMASNAGTKGRKKDRAVKSAVSTIPSSLKRSPPHSSASAVSKEDKVHYICPICDEPIVDAVGNDAGHDSVECSGTCATWLHRCCAGLSKVAFQVVRDSNDPFYCSQCRLDRQERDIISLKTLVTNLSSHLALISDELATLRSSQLTTATTAEATDEATGSQLISSSSRTLPTYYPHDALGVFRPLYSHSDMPSRRRSNLILSGLPESCKGTPRYLRTRQDLECAGEILSSIDSLVTVNTICDCFRLGKYKENNSRPRPLLVKLSRPSDVQSILMGRKNLASRPGIGIKPDLSADDRKIESLLLKERRSLIVSGVERKNIRISGSTIYVNKQKYGIILDGGFKKSSDVIHAPSCSPSRISLASDTSYHSTPTGVDVAASQSDLRNPSHASKHLS